VRVSERDFTDKDFDDVVDALNAGDLVSRYSGVLAGKRVYVYTVKQKFLANEVVFLKTAVYPECKAKDGTRYTAVVTAAIPDALAQDLDLADYVIYSFKC
jgi:hypothetical protein